ncbi:unnamed protein product [Spirodela intermedia]|uniref:Uncharacterized protein n=1 Tax=Spirodela intermedia TaxID=51605 RepID=A0ABN7EDP8_SPIIN|nr:unnamed protein product [Spirodela intermedia]
MVNKCKVLASWWRCIGDRLIKWVIKSFLMTITRKSRKIITFKRRLFIISVPFLHVYDHSLPHSRLATSDMEGE